MQGHSAALYRLIGDTPATVEDLAIRRGVPTAEIETALTPLRRLGLITTGADGRVRRVGTPGLTPLGVASVVPGDYEVVFEDSVSSTNDLARRLTAECPTERFVVLARAQTAGRGRHDRAWSSPRGGIWASVVDQRLRPPSLLKTDHMAMAVAVAATARACGLAAYVMWPNDVVTSADEKIAGILMESNIRNDMAVSAICGVGINVNVPRHKLPPAATSLQHEVGTLNRLEFLRHLLFEYERRRTTPKAVCQTWCDWSAIIGREVEVTLAAGDSLTGIATDVTTDGRLILDTREGTQSIRSDETQKLHLPNSSRV